MTLKIRKFRKQDISELFSWFETERDALQWAGAGLSWPLNRGVIVDLVRQHRGRSPPREVWAVEQQGCMIGHFQLSYNRRLETVGAGRIAIAPRSRGQNLSKPLMGLLLAQAFRPDWVHRVDLLVYSHNTVAIRTYETAGFVLEGTRRETTPIDGDRWDTHVMSVLRSEFDIGTERE